jgi:hypothetical protein
MFQLRMPFRSLHRTSARRPSHCRLYVERLEDRQLLSATSAIAWYGNGIGASLTHRFYAIDAQSSQVVQYDDAHGPKPQQYLYGPCVTDVSASIGSNGIAEVFALATDHSVWVNMSGSWHNLGGSATMISAINGRVYAIASNGSVWFNTDTGSASTWTNIGGYALTISATAYHGQDEVFAIGGDNNMMAIWVNSTTGVNWQLVDSQRKFSKISATQNNEVYALDATGRLFRETYQQAASGNLIVNGNFEQGNMGFSSGYTYSPGNLWPEATYAVTTNPHSEHPLGESYGDHTTGSGYMMAVNGATPPNVVVWSETIKVVPNTTYDFGLWVSNWSSTRTNLAQLAFLFNGQQIGAYTEPVPAGVWQQYTNTWYSGNNTSLTIRIVDQNTVAYGNDFALDDISLQRSHWQERLISSKQFTAISTDMANSTHSEVYAIDVNHNLYNWSSATQILVLRGINVEEIAAADYGYFFERRFPWEQSSQAWEFTPGHGWYQLGGEIR